MIVGRAYSDEANITDLLTEDHNVRQRTICATCRCVLGYCWFAKNSGSRLHKQKSHHLISPGWFCSVLVEELPSCVNSQVLNDKSEHISQ